MSFSKEKMVKLILNESESIEERYPGYRKEILNAIVQILNAEREHKEQRTTIQKNVNKACHSTGDVLARNLDKETTQ